MSETEELEKLKYPIGKFKKPETYSKELLQDWAKDIAEFPALLKAIVTKLSDKQLDVPYRPLGWTSRQVVHHLADSHMNSFMRFKLALSEENPAIKLYFEDRWAEMEDELTYSIEPSIQILEGLHKRWVVMLGAMSDADFERTFFHPEKGSNVGLKENLGIYSWHGKHHLAQISSLVDRMKW